jgi:hypothetical protein
MADTSDRVGFRLPVGNEQVSRQLDLRNNLILANDKYPNEIATSAVKPSTGLFNGKYIFETNRGVHLVRRTGVNRWWPINGILLGRVTDLSFNTSITSTGPSPGTDVDLDTFSFSIPGGLNETGLGVDAAAWRICLYLQIYFVHAVRGFANFRVKRIGIGSAVNTQEGDFSIPARIEATNTQTFMAMATVRGDLLPASYNPTDPWAVKMGFWLASAGTNVFKGASMHAWLSPVEDVWS